MITTFICMLPKQTQQSIRHDLANKLSELGYKGAELLEAVQNGMDGRLCDVEEVIDIKKYANQ